MNIGLVIKALRSDKGLSQEALALEADTATSNLSRIEKGLRTPSLELLYRLGKALDISMSELFRAAESGNIATNKKKAAYVTAAHDQELPDYDDHAVQVRNLFRELTPTSRGVALVLMKSLKSAQKTMKDLQ